MSSFRKEIETSKRMGKILFLAAVFSGLPVMYLVNLQPDHLPIFVNIFGMAANILLFLSAIFYVFGGFVRLAFKDAYHRATEHSVLPNVQWQKDFYTSSALFRWWVGIDHSGKDVTDYGSI